MSEQKAAHVGWGFWFQWVLASTVGLGLLGIRGYPVYLDWLMTPSIIGTIQWLILRKHVSHDTATAWMSVSILSWAIGLFGLTVPYIIVALTLAHGPGGGHLPFIHLTASLIDGRFVTMALAWAGGGAVIGAVIGTIQWLIILRRQVSQASWWVLASIVGWAIVGWAIAWLLDNGYYFWGRGEGLIAPTVGVGLAGAAYGASTGGTLVWLLRQPRPVAQSVAADAHHSPGGDDVGA